MKELYEVFYINVTPFLEITDDFVVLDEAIHPNINIDGKQSMKIACTLGAETFASGKIREIFVFREHKLSRIGQNRILRVLNFREWTEKLNFLRKRLDLDRNKRENKTSLFQAFVVLGLVFVHQTFF